ncbi:MAG: hypothetical protein U0L42_10555 [Methanobrevibacter sp.]|uniref:hypothetical protein n=1 Tax=Methanobrevibacter sp. TaxID=66852 RepID=UPI002E78A080|nr:hypothetical protein [Methanobrevibacter sp.]MEE0936102.1 hypothetical protein [Methanobrevibacter sp.]
MSNVAELPTKDTITLIINRKNVDKVTYVFKNRYGNKIGEYTNKSPATLSSQSNVARQFKQIVNPKGDLKPRQVNNQFSELKQLLQLNYENELSVIEQELADKKQAEQEKDASKLKEAITKLQSLDCPLIYIGSIVEWFTAGERNNILYAFTVYAGQVILQNPVSVICLGEASSGKSHIQETALKLIPKRFVVNEKKITEAALFNRAKKDKYFYDGKIVNYGDMGGSNDHEFMEESKNLMKELQSDGFLNKPLNISDGEGGWDVKDLELVGRPCLTYTTVPNHYFDDQEMSRSIFITPRMDNQKIFNQRNSALEFKHGRSYKILKQYEREAELVPYMLLHLKEVFEDIVVINPYVYFVINFLKNSSFYKRDFDKFNGLLKTITALNYYNHEVYDIGGKKVILTNIADVQLFMSLLKPYKESISANLAPKAVEVLNDIRNNIDEWRMSKDREVLDMGITTNDYFSLQSLGLSKASARKYMYELADKGFLQITDHVGRSNVYDLAKSEVESINYDLKHIDDSTYENICYEIGEWVVDIMKEDKFVEGLSIMNFDSTVKKPTWIDKKL